MTPALPPALLRPLAGPRTFAIAAYVALFTAVGAHAPYLPVYLRSIGFGMEQIGLLAAVAAAIGLLGGPLWGMAADRMAGSRLVMPAAAAVAALAAAMLASASGFAAVALLIGLLSLAMSGIYPVLDTHALEVVADDRHRYARLRVWGSASFIASAFAVGWLVERTSVAALFAVLVPALAVTAVIGLGLGSRREVEPLARLNGMAAVLRQRVLAGFLLAALVAWSASSMINSFFSIHLVEIGAPESLIGISWAIGAVVEVPLMIGFPWLAARFGVEPLLLGGALLLVLRGLLLAVVDDPLLATLTMLVHGGGFALLLVGGVTYVARSAPPGAAATAQGILSGIAFGLAFVIGPGLGGTLAGQFGLSGMFIVATTMSGFAVAVLAWSLRAGDRGRSTVLREPGQMGGVDA